MKQFNLYEGKLIDEHGKVTKKWDFKHLGVINNSFYYAQKEDIESLKDASSLEEKPVWGKFSSDGKEIWTSDIPIHHDLIVTPQNTIMTFTKEMHRYRGRNVDFCVIIEFEDGKEIWKWSSWDNFKKLKKHHKLLELDMPFIPLVKKKPTTVWGGNYDYYRFNSLQIIPKNNLTDERFKEGNILVSVRHGSMIFILDESGEIVWFISQTDVPGNIEGQHAVQMLKNGNLLIFDNGRYRGWSRVIELNPVSMKIEWEYKADDFYTTSQGYAQRLDNGNTLITESEKGRVFEIDKDGNVTWEFLHPDMQNEDNSPLHPECWGKRQWIYRMTRYQSKQSNYSNR